MVPVPLSDFHEAVRTLIGDGGDAVGGYDYPAAQLDGALRTVVRMGNLPCLALVAGTNPEFLAAAPPNADTWGYLAAKAASYLIGGSVQESIRTRAMSILVDPASRRDAVTYLDTLLSDLDARGNLCGTAEDTGHQGLFGTADDFITAIAFPLRENPELVGFLGGGASACTGNLDGGAP